VERRLAAILAADIVGFSRQMAIDEENVLASQAALHKELIYPKITQYGGRIFKTTGDGYLAEFSSVVNAFRAAVNIQLAMRAGKTIDSKLPRLVYRMGINIGDIVAEDDDVYGNGVNVAVRLEGLAEPGGICVSQTVSDHVRGKVASGFTDLGRKELKNIPEPVQAFQVEMRLEKSNSERPAVRKLLNRSIFAGAILLICALAVLVWQRPWQIEAVPSLQSQLSDAALAKPSIAVMPLLNLSGNQTQDYFADGVTDDLISDMSGISGLFVISRNTSFSFRGKNIKIAEIARELGVQYVLEGSIRRGASEFRINAQLVDSRSGRQIWSERYDFPEGNLFKVKNQIVTKVVEALSVQLTKSEIERLKQQPTDNLEAYDYYLRAEKASRGWDDNEQRGLELYNRATELDPSFANAYAGYARIAVDVWQYELNGVMPAGLARKRAYEAISQAVKLDEKNARAKAVLSRIQILEGYPDLGIASAEESVALSPNDVGGLVALANAYVISGRKIDALAIIKEAIRRSPNPTPQLRAKLGWVQFYNGIYDEAISNLELAQSDGVSYFDTLAMAYAQSNQLEKAKIVIGQMLAHANRANVQLFRLQLAHFAKSDDLHQMVQAMRKAGLPEWPFDFKAPKEQKLDHIELKKITFAQTWQGSSMNVSSQFFQEIQKNGKFAYRDNLAIVTGEYSIDVDMLCQISANFAMGRRQCGYVYLNPEGTQETNDYYIYVNTYSVLKFSVIK
jgi:adenylate cyclase